eukprot:symbB.v1.2.012256.t1/scaffold843.1/size158467/7
MVNDAMSGDATLPGAVSHESSSSSGLGSEPEVDEPVSMAPSPQWQADVAPPSVQSPHDLPERLPSRGRRNSVDILMSKAKSGAAAAMQGVSLAPSPELEAKKRKQRIAEAWAEPSNVLARHASSMQHGCGSSFVLKESNMFRKFWGFIVGLLLLYTGTIFPYKLAFIEFYIGGTEEMEKESTRAWAPIEQTVDILFWIDLFLIFIFSYKD